MLIAWHDETFSKGKWNGSFLSLTNITFYAVCLLPFNFSADFNLHSTFITLMLFTTNKLRNNPTLTYYPVLQLTLRPLYNIKRYFPQPTSAKCNSVRKPYTNLPDTPAALASASKYFEMLPAPPGALESALRFCKSILTCSWKHLQWGRCIQDATKFDN